MGHHRGGCRCELCGAPAAVHCAADAAFLCAACDAKVHGANFLASRHRRTRLLLAAPDECGYESGASSCVSTAVDSAAPPPRRTRGGGSPGPRSRGEAVLEAWARRTGLTAADARRRAAAAARALRARAPGLASARVAPRVAMAAALWREVAGRGGTGGGGHGHGEALRRLEACAHVPAGLVVAVAKSMARARGRGDEADTDAAAEGWDECAWAGPKSSPPRP
jgi:hypothetical protein